MACGNRSNRCGCKSRCGRRNNNGGVLGTSTNNNGWNNNGCGCKKTGTFVDYMPVVVNYTVTPADYNVLGTSDPGVSGGPLGGNSPFGGNGPFGGNSPFSGNGSFGDNGSFDGNGPNGGVAGVSDTLDDDNNGVNGSNRRPGRSGCGCGRH